MSETVTAAPEGVSEQQPVADAPADFRASMAAVADAIDARERGDEPAAEAPAEAAGQPRNPDGKFAAKASDALAAPSEAAAEPAKEALAPPEWLKGGQTDWNRLPRAVQEDLLARQPPQAQPAEVFRPIVQGYEQEVAQAGVPPEQLFRNYLAADRALRTNPDEAFRWLADAYKYDLNRLAPQAQTAAQPDQAGYVDPQVSVLHNEIATLKQQLASINQTAQSAQQMEHARTQAEVQRELSDFSKDRPHFEAVRQDMAILIQSGRAKDLAAAYEMATWANPQTRAALIAEQRQAEEAKRAEEASKRLADAQRAKVATVRSTPGTAPAPTLSIRDTMAAAYDRANGAA